MNGERSPYVMLAIRSEHAARIYSGEKRAELRKSFADCVRLVFLYEVAPMSAVTGAFVVGDARREPLKTAVRSAQRLGVPKERAEAYFSGRSGGWVVEIKHAVRFEAPLSIERLRLLNHYFSPPQAFSYLDRFEALTQCVLSEFGRAIARRCKVVPADPERYSVFESLVMSSVGTAYDDIDADFVRQQWDDAAAIEGAFSTRKKHVLEIRSGPVLLGFSVLTEKYHGAWKSGPTVLLREFRGIGIGSNVREVVEAFAEARGARSIYCTCSDEQPGVLSYLLRSGMHVQARLRAHLSISRDEFVLARVFRPRPPRGPVRRQAEPELKGLRASRVKASSRHMRPTLAYFLKEMPYWYFAPRPGLTTALLRTLHSEESGEWGYSEKPRRLYRLASRPGTIRGLVLATRKRSSMAKLNLVVTSRDASQIEKLLRLVMSDLDELRRVYLTVPANQSAAIQAVVNAGFACEGVLSDPFGRHVDHVCFGLVKKRTRKRGADNPRRR